jgi:hypothetical protein
MGRFSKGKDNYNMHFQGAIHLGFSLLHLQTIVDKNVDTRCIELQYIGECCEENLDDILISTLFQPPYISTDEENPLLYSSIQNLPPSMKPGEKNLVEFIRSGNPAEAIAFIICTTSLIGQNIYILGITERSNPATSSIGVAEVLGAA